ncbi:unnamed protein product [Aureobasidium pullulans]|nr:unnamed protein product [Aureobasidium pullulans]
MALPAGQKRLALRLLNLEAEYTVLTAINPATRTYEEDARIRELYFLCLAHGLPSEVKNNVLEYYIPGLEPVDIADPTNHTRPTWCTDDEAEFLYWRHTRFIFRTDDLTRTNLDNKINAAQTLIQNNLCSTAHPARLFYMQPKKKIIFEIYLKIDLSVGGAAEIDDENLEALWRLLELLNGEMEHLQLKFIWKNDTNPNDISAATKREVATNNSAPFAAIKQNLLAIVLAAARHYTTCMHAPATVNPITRWARYLSPMTATDPATTDAHKFAFARDWSTLRVSGQVSRMWTTRNKRGFVLWSLCGMFNVPIPRDDGGAATYGWWMGTPTFPLDLGDLA